MKVILIEKAQWEPGVEKARDSYRLFGPVSQGPFYQFRQLEAG